MDLKIFTKNIEPDALEQVYRLLSQEPFKDCKVRIMPDVHAGAGCVIGFTANLGNKVIPNVVGVDIGCGMLTVELGKQNLDLAKLDQVIRKYVPSGFEVHKERKVRYDKIQNMKCFRQLKDTRRLERSIGTLGGGNHFIEIDVDDEGNKYLVIHTGSRNLGKQVAELYQEVAIRNLNELTYSESEKANIIKLYKEQGRSKEISTAIEKLSNNYKNTSPSVPKELCYLEGMFREDYLHDMKICQEFAIINRATIADIILMHMELEEYSRFETIHNYIDLETNIVRKGAISAKLGERVLIPINMRDGCIIAIGKGNEDWNYSAPHGAGRIMSRRQAKQNLDLNSFKKEMLGVYSTTIGADTLDEAPMAYKPMEEILENIKDTVDVEKIIRPIYNYKAAE